ncbi:MAG: hypothetical protein ACLVG7_10725 [Negativibacillus sp.]
MQSCPRNRIPTGSGTSRRADRINHRVLRQRGEYFASLPSPSIIKAYKTLATSDDSNTEKQIRSNIIFPTLFV